MIISCIAGKRTGSTFLDRCLNSHPDIKAYGEIFQISVIKSLNGMDHWFDKNIDENKIYKVIYNQANYWKITDILIEKNIPIIHLIRNNAYRKVLSEYITNINKGKPRNINVKSFMQKIIEYELNINVFRDKLKSNTQYIEIYMEDIIGTLINKNKNMMTIETSKKLCNFLNIDFFEMYSDSKKLSPAIDHWSYIKNADKIKEALKNKGLYNKLYEDKFKLSFDEWNKMILKGKLNESKMENRSITS